LSQRKRVGTKCIGQDDAASGVHIIADDRLNALRMLKIPGVSAFRQGKAQAL
jgi:hypothetical protein